MEIEKLIKERLKENKIVLGFNTVMKSLKSGHPEVIVYADNIPEERKKIIEHNAQISKVEIKEYPSDSVNLGLLCGKPFPVSILAIMRGKK